MFVQTVKFHTCIFFIPEIARNELKPNELRGAIYRAPYAWRMFGDPGPVEPREHCEHIHPKATSSAIT